MKKIIISMFAIIVMAVCTVNFAKAQAGGVLGGTFAGATLFIGADGTIVGIAISCSASAMRCATFGNGVITLGARPNVGGVPVGERVFQGEIKEMQTTKDGNLTKTLVNGTFEEIK